MKQNLLLAAILLFTGYVNTSLAQQSCSFIIHVNGDNGTDDVNCGTEASPCETINYGIGRAVTEGYSDVRIASTIAPYSEIIELQDGVNLWGGFDSQWAFTATTTVQGGEDSNGEFYTVKAENINATTVISDLSILAPNASTAGKSSYGIHTANSTGLVLQRVAITGGTGAQGTSGTNGTDATTIAANGANGGDGDEYNTACNDGSSGIGGAGVETTGYPNTRGGNGGRGGYMDEDCSFVPDYDATPGVNGSNATVFVLNGYGYRGSGGGTCNDGTDGNDGQTVHGTGGAGATSSATLAGNFWSATSGDPGTLGENGTGGGGGGGSGGCDSGTDSYGAGGGGGGSGGIAAPTFGTGALSGGNSAALFLLNSTCSVIDCNFTLGSGSIGGAGGNGGNGTAGGNGGNGGTAPGTGDAGDGGDGGDGGNSGGGGGGAAGSAYGIYGINSTVNRMGNAFSGGSAGIAGQGGAGTPSGVEGGNGAAGEVLDIAGTVTDNQGVLALEDDPCLEIITAELSVLEFCAGQTTTVTFTAVGSFTGANVFTAQLSDASGDFTSPVDIGSITSATAGPITVTFPAGTPSGTGYTIRVVSSATPSVGTETTAAITINELPTVVANTTLATVCAGSETTLTGSGADTYTWNNNVTDGQAFVPQATGYFTVEGVNTTTQCSATDSVMITVIDLPDTSVVQNGNLLGAILGGATYQWVDCDNNYVAINGEEGQTFAPSASGNYAVIVTQGGCSDTSSCYNVMTVGLDDMDEQEIVLLLYPNPSSGQFQMISNAEKPMEVTVFNMMGQAIYSNGNVTANNVIDLTGVENGMYFIRFHNDDLNMLRQVVVQR